MKKIDEAINRVIDMYCNLRNGYIDHLTYGGKGDAETEADIHALDEVLTALYWYIGQDLIRRKDVVRMTLPYWTTVSLVRDKVMQIPKVEYKGDDNDDKRVY